MFKGASSKFEVFDTVSRLLLASHLSIAVSIVLLVAGTKLRGI